jgi:hypothetical protein
VIEGRYAARISIARLRCNQAAQRRRKAMIVAIHQPCFLPWLGYLDRMAKADLFIVLDHVQFERRNYQNRTRICVDGQAQWLTVPVHQRSQLEKICDKQIDNPPAHDDHWWGADHARTLRHAYRNAPFLADFEAPLRRILGIPHSHLADLNLELLDFLREAMGIDTPMVKSSELKVAGARSELILNLCLATGADTYLAGMGGSRSYLDVEAFRAAGVDIVWQDFQHPHYAQCGSNSFIAGLSAVDFLFNEGALPRRRPQQAAFTRRLDTHPGQSLAVL